MLPVVKKKVLHPVDAQIPQIICFSLSRDCLDVEGMPVGLSLIALQVREFFVASIEKLASSK